ncbi:Crp/Fnr family transcriptional regulator [Weissella coleopterorum]|uniref:Crp/Fnr family transcriptional regulator n=1 Tax=Weissella coleopterorum TaxID=2714949 RepID=A0A6G8AY96_9LACO|nr:Crp/Fnr family transcriptional regulator [Weissella coleopterorum]QIL50038.1 Crp/Fnr family transcriptional regulator [Weissella coleopterorum]
MNPNKLYDLLLGIDSEYVHKIKIHKGSFLIKSGDLETNIYVLIVGVVITSITEKDGRSLNIDYIKGPNIVTALKDENEKVVEQPLDVLVDSDEAEFYKINRLKFWEAINANVESQIFMRNYYRQRLDNSIVRLKRQMSNNRKGQVCTFIYELVQLFGVTSPLDSHYILINQQIRHQTIAEFCGINSRTSVTRIINRLVSDNVIVNEHGYITVKDLEYLKQFV